MENASKALRIASGVLIALIIISSMLLVFNSLSDYQKVNSEVEKDKQVVAFNNQFETYNRTDVRGSDLISLANKVLDYNKRKSFSGTEGKDIGYKPIKLTIYLGQNINNIQVPNYEDNKLYFLNNKDSNGNYVYTTDENKNDFANVLSQIDEIESDDFALGLNQSDYTKLAASYLEEIFLPKEIYTNNASEANKYAIKNAIRKYKDITGQTISTSDYRIKLGQDSKIRENTYKYYEYLQFKRSYFNCTQNPDPTRVESGFVYDDSGRIIEMYFVGNGKLE